MTNAIVSAHRLCRLMAEGEPIYEDCQVIERTLNSAIRAEGAGFRPSMMPLLLGLPSRNNTKGRLSGAEISLFPAIAAKSDSWQSPAAMAADRALKVPVPKLPNDTHTYDLFYVGENSTSLQSLASRYRLSHVLVMDVIANYTPALNVGIRYSFVTLVRVPGVGESLTAVRRLTCMDLASGNCTSAYNRQIDSQTQRRRPSYLAFSTLTGRAVDTASTPPWLIGARIHV
jgi:hypothetical protein